MNSQNQQNQNADEDLEVEVLTPQERLERLQKRIAQDSKSQAK